MAFRDILELPCLTLHYQYDIRILNHFLSLFVGRYCAQDVDECRVNSDICKNSATCLNKNGSYQCICVNGYTGEDCSVNIDDCAHDPCYDGGTCIDMVGYYVCECPESSVGKFLGYYFINTTIDHSVL